MNVGPTSSNLTWNPKTAAAMTAATRSMLEVLTPRQREAMCFAFDNETRYHFDFRPLIGWHRDGLRLVNMDADQQSAFRLLLKSALSLRGVEESLGIMRLELILRETERREHVASKNVRDPELYSIAVFGRPGEGPWMWRLEGHHLSLHFTVIDAHVSVTPLFFGAHPATVEFGSEAGMRTLANEEELARTLMTSLDQVQRARVMVAEEPPVRILSGLARSVDPAILPRGLALPDLAARQQRHLLKLIRHYLGRVTPEVAGNRWTLIKGELSSVSFGWAGSQERSKPHYYLIRGETFMIEYDNSQSNANHIHTMWREYDGDWGEDILAAHYLSKAHHHDHD